MNNKIYQLNPIAKSIRVIFSALIISSASTACIAAEEITSSGININNDAVDSQYFIASGTTINGASATAPVNINDNIVTSVTNGGVINNTMGSAITIENIAGNLVNTNGITAKEYGVAINGARTLEVNNSGTLYGEAAGIHVASSAAINNTGTIGRATDNYGILVDSGTTTITNSGTIAGSKAAIQFNTSGNQLILKNNTNLSGDVMTSLAGNTIIMMDSGNEDSNFMGNNTGNGFSLLEMRGTEWNLGGDIDLIDAGAGPTLKVTRGKLILTGEVNNNGESLIADKGTLQLGDGSKTALFNGKSLTNNGTLIFNQGENSEFSGSVTGSGNIIKTDNSTLTLSGNNAISGTTTLDKGTTLVSGTLSSSSITMNNNAILATKGLITGNVLVNSGATLSSWEGTSGTTGTSDNTIRGNVSNAGTLNLAAKDNTVGTRMTIDGDYHGESGSKIIMNTVAGDDNSQTDHLTITQNSSGSSAVSITNSGGNGAQTINGIEVISVGGSSDATFNLASPVTAGKWEYDLKKKDNNWYLVSEKPEEPDNGDNSGYPDNGNNGAWNSPEVLAPETSAYLGNYQAAQQMFIHKRDDREQLLSRAPDQNSGWMYVRGRYNENNVDGDRGSYDTTTHVFQLGSDLFSRKLGEGEWHTGFMLGTGLSVTHADATYNTRSAKGHVSGYNVGLYSTWQEDPELRLGSYVDSWVSTSWYDSWVKGDGLNRENYSSQSVAASLEAGHAWMLDSDSDRHWKIEPQGQVVFNYLNQRNHYDYNGTYISDPDNSSYLTRLGVRFSNVDKVAPGAWQPFITANWLNGGGMNDLQFNGETASDETPENRGQLEIGISGDMNEATTISLRATGEWGENSYNAWGGHILWNYRW